MNNIERLQQTYRYEIAEGFIKINASGKLQHTTNEELGIEDDVHVGLEDVLQWIDHVLNH